MIGKESIRFVFFVRILSPVIFAGVVSSLYGWGILANTHEKNKFVYGVVTVSLASCGLGLVAILFTSVTIAQCMFVVSEFLLAGWALYLYMSLVRKERK